MLSPLCYTILPTFEDLPSFPNWFKPGFVYERRQPTLLLPETDLPPAPASEPTSEISSELGPPSLSFVDLPEYRLLTGPVLLGPTLPPPAAAPLSPRASKAVTLAPAPEPETTFPLAPASPPVQIQAPHQIQGFDQGSPLSINADLHFPTNVPATIYSNHGFKVQLNCLFTFST
ncbi:hypothetical protein GH714_025306 [Hevea brasiliensis]|uniref:Uncharacterized protein n=1 Tax=Hevea brasiliensis TaxID=3981 RepID=A0A6A6NJ02_HEVBR|nr:hypothetical protein GH714_025306 [Hevea brasiliensis]